MCGIAGLWLPQRDQPPEALHLWEMIHALKHRGPDGQYVWQGPGVGLAHARLSILDLEARANQPMHDPETGCVLTFNGEIYNYIEIRAQLAELGHHFRTTSDTEVLLKAYLAWDVSCLDRFNGMWSFALYDPRRDQLFCARDRFGVKPFVYATLPNGHMAFASETKALLAAYPQLAQPHLGFTQHFLQGGAFAAEAQTFYQPVQNLLPGHAMLWRRGQTPRTWRYWAFEPHAWTQRHTHLADAEALEQFEALLTDALRLRFRSDVPVGVSLSGGLDSSSLVALTATRLGEPLRTFSCIYPQYPVLDESAYIRLTTQQFAANATYTTPALPLDAPLAAIDRCIYEQDGPTGTPAVWSQRAVMQLASPHVRVLLDGQGGDEVLGGYHSYFPWALRGLMRQALRQPWQVQRWQAWQQSASAIAARQQGQAAPSWRTAYEGLGQAGGLLKRGLPPAKFDAHPWGASALDVVQPIAEDDLSTRMLQDLMYSSLPALLHYEDRNSMAFSIESRLPFLDYRLVSWVYALPPRFKIRQARTKWLLFETMKDILPHPVAYRREKLGYETPGSAWLLAPEVANVLDKVLKHPPEALAALPPDYWQKRATQWQQCRREGQVPAKIERVLWRLLTVVRWLSMEAARKQPPGVLGHDAQPPAPVLC